MSGHVSQTAAPTHSDHEAGAWAGGTSPFKMSYGKMMMWFFLISDALTFGGFLGALGYMRHAFSDTWPVSEQVFFHFPFVSHDVHLPLLYVAMMTFILIISSVTMVLAVEAGHRMDKKGVVFWLGLTVVGGLIFLGSQVWEWSTFIHGSDHGSYRIENVTAEVQHDGTLKFRDGTTMKGAEAEAFKADAQFIQGAGLTQNEYGHPLYAAFFFFITGFHGTHVASGVVLNIIILLNARKGVYQKRGHYEMVEKAGLYWHFVDLVWVFVFTFFYLI